MIDEHSTVQRAQGDLPETDTGSEQVLVDRQSGARYGLNPVAAYLFPLLSEPVRVGALADAVADRYDVDRERALSDLCEFLDEVERLGFVVVVQPPPTRSVEARRPQ